MTGARSSPLGLLVLALTCVGLGIVLDRTLLTDPGPAAPPTYLARLASDLDLSPEQISAVARVLDEEDRKLRALRDDHAEAMREPVAARREVTETEILALLDDGQRQRYESLTAR